MDCNINNETKMPLAYRYMMKKNLSANFQDRNENSLGNNNNSYTRRLRPIITSKFNLQIIIPI